LATAPPEAAGAEEAPLVNVIEISGLRRTEDAAVREKIMQRTGQPLSPETVSEDIKSIYKMGYFEDVRVEVEPFEGGIKLIYVLKEKPSIMRVEFQGNKKLEDSKLREKVTLSPGSMADTVLVQDNADKLKAFYEAEGYPLAIVVPVLRRTADGRAYLTYQIDEGSKVKIDKIEITGNEALSDRKVKKAMKTSEWWLFSFITRGGHYERSVLTADVDRIKDLYYDNGYIQASVSEPSVKFSEDKEWMDIAIEVSEGEQFTVSSLEFSGDGVFTEAELREKITSKPGEVLSKGRLWADVAVLTDMYSDKGYATANVFPDIIPDEKKKQAAVVFKVTSGDLYRIGRIDISGNQKTRDKVIRREMRLDEGALFSGSQLKRSYQRINNLNIFEEVNLKPRPDPEEKTVDVEVQVKERPTGFISVGGGYSSIDRWIGTVDFTQGNLGGRGQYLKLRGEFGSRTSFYELSFRDPWFLDRPVSFTASLYNTSREYVDYKKKATGFMLGFGKSLGEYWGGNLAYRFENATISDISENASSIIKDQEGERTTSSISPTLSRDSRDNFLDPHSGSRNVLSATYAGLGGTNKFFKGTVDSSWFIPMGPSLTLSLRGRYGYATGVGGENLPLYERFYVGGIYTIRGLDFGEAGPEDETGTSIGGTEELIFNADFIFPILPSIKLKGVLFFDAGGSYDDKLDRIWTTAGAGVRWVSPIGPIRLEWGKNLDPEPGETVSKFEFAFGTFF
jgi:outer membrane protein insertion porin family